MNPLGQPTVYTPQYDPTLLFPLPRKNSRQAAGLPEGGLEGYDLWNGYEFSWLDEGGKPQVRRFEMIYSARSENIVESKSLKLYLGSFAMTRFSGEAEVVRRLEEDIGGVLKSPRLTIRLLGVGTPVPLLTLPRRQNLDRLSVPCEVFHPVPELLETRSLGRPRDWKGGSDLLRSLCPVTGQPDFASVVISYRSRLRITDESLLRYLVSFREHQDFHETCCEKIFFDLKARLQPAHLSVRCFFTRRGGLDINPCRYFGKHPGEKNLRTGRQ